MKRITHSLFLVAVALTLAAIAYFYLAERGSRQADEPIRFRQVDAGTAPGIVESSAESQTRAKTASAIPLEPNETLLDLFAFNLDYDDEEEQILVIRESDDPTGRIHILVADYSPFTKRWTRAWKGSTPITKVKTFQVNVIDLIGDHNLNIVCTGMNDANEQTMTVFWKAQGLDDRQSAACVPIFQEAGTSVVIEPSDRPDSYKLGQSNAESWPISVWKADASSGNYLDQLREQWVWSFTDTSYVLVSTERIPGASIARKIAESILDGKPETFKAFLDGTWYKESIDPRSPSAVFITFQSRDESVLFSGEGLIEVYNWENSNPTRYGLYIASRNQSVRNLRRLMDIELAAADAINVRVFQDYRIKADISGKWDGRYRRLGPELAKSFKRPPAMASGSTLSLNGSFGAEDGSTISFEGSGYRLEGPMGLEAGSFALYELGKDTILELRSLPLEASKRSTFIASLDEQRGKDGKALARLTLREAVIGLLGAEPTQTAPRVFYGP